MVREKLKDNRGFTIIELVAVIAILLIITAIAMPSITSLFGRTEEKISKEKERAFISAAREYVSDNYNTVLPDGKTKCYVSLETLYSMGYLSENSYKDTDGNEYSGDDYYIVYEYDKDVDGDGDGDGDDYSYKIDKSGVSECNPS